MNRIACWLMVAAFLQGATSLDQIKAIAEPMRGQRSPAATAEFKRLLREWSQERMGDTESVNTDLDRAGLFCHAIACDTTQIASGYAIPVRRVAQGDWTAMITGAGIYCGTDEDATFYRAGKPVGGETSGPPPLSKLQVEFSGNLALVTGVTTSCVSAWQRVFFRLYRLDEKLTLLGTIERNINIVEPRRGQRLDPTGFTAEIPYRGIDPFATFTRPHVIRYEVDGDALRRVEPVALRPVDFVDEWLTQPWAAIAPWSDPSTESTHASLYRPNLQAEILTEVECQSGKQIEVLIDGVAYFFQVQSDRVRSYRMLRVGTARNCPGTGHPDYLNDRPTLFPPVQ